MDIADCTTEPSTVVVMLFNEDAAWLVDKLLRALITVAISPEGLLILSRTAPTVAALGLAVDPATLRLLMVEQIAVRMRSQPKMDPVNDKFDWPEVVIVPGTLSTPVAVLIMVSLVPFVMLPPTTLIFNVLLTAVINALAVEVREP